MSDHTSLEQQVVAFLRDSMARRYALANIREYEEFDALSDSQVEALRDFGLRHIYPEWEDRCFQLEAFDSLLALLNSPRRLKPLVAVTLKSMWRLGRQLPRAIEAGKEIISAFEATRSLENRILDDLREALPHNNADPSTEDIARALHAIPEEEFASFVDDIVSLMRLLAQRPLLEAGLSVLRDVAAAMEKRRDYYEEIQLDGIHYALTVMEEGMALFDTLDEDAVHDAIEAVGRIEREWFAEAGANEM